MIGGYKSFGKRVVDLVTACGLIVIASPVLLVLGLFVRVLIGTPILFVQQRPGRYGVPFRIYKFRSMTNARARDGTLLRDDQRLTRAGRLLRATSLDELPELVNVIKGDMSLVGPRPLLLEYLSLYTTEQMRRHEVRPGITGLAQVSGRNQLAWEERFGLDVWYVDNISFMLDLKILAKTVTKVFRGEGIVEQGHATMSKFGGSLD